MPDRNRGRLNSCLRNSTLTPTWAWWFRQRELTRGKQKRHVRRGDVRPRWVVVRNYPAVESIPHSTHRSSPRYLASGARQSFPATHVFTSIPVILNRVKDLPCSTPSQSRWNRRRQIPHFVFDDR